MDFYIDNNLWHLTLDTISCHLWIRESLGISIWNKEQMQPFFIAEHYVKGLMAPLLSSSFILFRTNRMPYYQAVKIYILART